MLVSIGSTSHTKILVVFPTGWDEKQLEGCRSAWADRYDVRFDAPDDHSCPWDFDVVAYVRERSDRPGEIDGVFSSSDYPGATVAGAIATRLGLPGSPPATVIGCSHKYYSRIAQREAAPEATPRFDLVDPRHGEPPSFGFPFFIKPVKGAFSVLAKRIDDAKGLEAFLAQPGVTDLTTQTMRIFNRLVAAFTDFEVNGNFFIAEELLRGRQVTLEGYVTDRDVEALGIVDSSFHPRTGSFIRFDYPSSLPSRVQTKMAGIARRVVARLGLRWSLFNVELMWNEATDDVSVVEVNPRMCGQFADLYQKVDGANGYEIALALAAGVRPTFRRNAGRYRVASSFPLRIFEAARVESAPGPDDVRAAEELFPETLVWSECETGQDLTDFASFEDGASARYAVVNLGADGPDELDERLGAVQERLGYSFAPVTQPT